MVRNSWFRRFIAFVSAFCAAALPAAGEADTRGIPVDPPACIAVLPALAKALT